MPTVNDIMEYAELLRTKPVVVIEGHCVRVRNRNAKCQKCQDVCIANAIEIGPNEIAIDPSLCVNCGACIAVCPTGAMKGLNPTREDFDNELFKAVQNAGAMAVIACARKASHNEGDPHKYATVPCLGRIEESMFTRLAAYGIEDIVLVDGVCETCKYGKVNESIDTTVNLAQDLLENQGSQAIITRTHEFPPEVVLHDQREILRESRRGFFTQAGGYARDVTVTVAQKAIADALNQETKQKKQKLRDRIGSAVGGKLPVFPAERNLGVLDDLCRMGEQACERMTTRLFGSVDIDPQACSGCGLCVMFCPTDALKYDTFDEPEDESMRFVEFQAADCTQCMLCADTCLRNAITVSPEVETDELFDFEPRLLEMPRPQKASFTFERLKNRR